MEKTKNDEKKERVLQSARECFARYGYAKTTLDDIAKGVKLNKASIYYYYPNKEAIFTEVILRESEEYISNLQRKVAAETDVEKKISSYLKERLDYYHQVINLHQLSVQFLREVEPVFDQLYEQVLEREVQFIAQTLEQGVQAKHFTELNTTQMARTILSIVDGIKFRAIQRSNVSNAAQVDYTKIKQEIDYILHFLFKGMK